MPIVVGIEDDQVCQEAKQKPDQKLVEELRRVAQD